MNHSDPDAESAYSLAEFAGTYAGHPEILSEVLAIFIDETPDKIASLRVAIVEENWVEVVRVAHSLANTTGTLKANGALRAARAVENAARAGDVATVKTAADVLCAELDRVIEVIREATQ